jgi:hypothetical protein
VVPARRCALIGPPNSSDSANGLHGEGEGEVKPFAGFQPGEGLRRIAYANGRTRCGEERGQARLSSRWLAEHLPEARLWPQWVRDDEPRLLRRARFPLAPGLKH